MVKAIFLLIFVISAFGGSSSLTNIECSYDAINYFVVDLVYRCKVNNNLNIITEESAQINEVLGEHTSSESNDDVTCFYAHDKTIQVFPKGLEFFFENLKAIEIQNCQLKEIHQSDLKVFPNLVSLDLIENEIEVIEEGLFDFSPYLEYVAIQEPKIIHIDPNVFKHLTKLSYFKFSQVPCVGQSIENSIKNVKKAIKIVKSNCSNSEFLSLENQIKNLEIESSFLNFEDFNKKLENLENNLKDSKFSKFRPLSTKFQNLKLKSVLDENILPLVTDRFECVKLLQSDSKVLFDELKSSQVSAIVDLKLTLKDTQNELNSTLTRISFLAAEHGAKLDQIQESQSQLNVNMTSILNDKFVQVDQSQNSLKTCLESVKASLKNSLDFSLTNLTSKFNDLKKDIKSTQDDTKLSINDIEVKLSDQKTFQNDVKDALLKVRMMQNELKLTLNDVKNSKNEDFEVKFMNFGESLEGHFVDFKVENSDRLGKIEKELTNKFHKMSTNFDEKIKGIEKRLMKKFEEILEEKLVKIFNEKLESLIDARTGKD